MIEPVRFLQGGGNDWERELLASTLRDEVPSGSRARVASGLGLAATAALAAPARARAPSGALGPIGKLTLLGLAGGLALLAGLPAGSSASRVGLSPRAPLPTGAAVLAARSPDPPAVPVPAVVELPVRDPTRRSTGAAALRAQKAPVSRHGPAPDPTARAAAPTRADGLLAEVRQLDRVHSALRASQAELALRLLDEYAAAFPRAALTLEATVLRVRALSESGEHAAAAALARRTLAVPGSERYRSDLERVIARDGRE